MKKWQLSCSIDGINIDHEEVIYSDTEPDFLDLLRNSKGKWL